MKSDVVIVGGGPGGSACALFLQKAGIHSVIVEKAEFPRYHIGESMTGECGNAVTLLGLQEEMAKFPHQIKWGTRVYGPRGDSPFYVPVKARTPEGELREASTWQVRRSDFDKMLFDTAEARGVGIIKGEAIAALRDGDAVTGVRVRTASGETTEIHSKVLIDASGQSSFLSRAGVLGAKDRGNYDNQVAIFSQVEGAIRDEGRVGADTLIFYQRTHHWAWFIPLDETTVSVGVVVPSEYFAGKKESKHDFLVRELHELNPELKRRLPEIKLTEEVRAISNYSYHIDKFTGPGYLCVGDSHRFIDPVFSFGLFFAMKEAEIAAGAVEEFLSGANTDQPNPFARYERYCNRGMDTIQDLIDAFWTQPLAFAVFVHSRYRDDCIDMFAGRVYMDEPSPGLVAFRKLNGKTASQPATAAV
ncbi:MAG TPA: NAD(P)/FAD-dependent oxidoreductase [Gemmatimonadaceae bacterium]|nr:NAD(P)/FAD-dependent oxidoreductase [Gemmatimonadaceae bacterium]